MASLDPFPEVNLTEAQKKKLLALGEGPVIFAYRDGTAIRAETMNGVNPYVWRDNNWVVMKAGQ